MSKYKHHHDEDECDSWHRSKPIKPEKPAEDPNDFVIVNTSDGSLKTRRCAHVEFGDRCNNPGTMSGPGGASSRWFCKKHFYSS
jgi:hypothetical protein